MDLVHLVDDRPVFYDGFAQLDFGIQIPDLTVNLPAFSQDAADLTVQFPDKSVQINHGLNSVFLHQLDAARHFFQKFISIWTVSGLAGFLFVILPDPINRRNRHRFLRLQQFCLLLFDPFQNALEFGFQFFNQVIRRFDPPVLVAFFSRDAASFHLPDLRSLMNGRDLVDAPFLIAAGIKPDIKPLAFKDFVVQFTPAFPPPD